MHGGGELRVDGRGAREAVMPLRVQHGAWMVTGKHGLIQHHSAHTASTLLAGGFVSMCRGSRHQWGWLGPGNGTSHSRGLPAHWGAVITNSPQVTLSYIMLSLGGNDMVLYEDARG